MMNTETRTIPVVLGPAADQPFPKSTEEATLGPREVLRRAGHYVQNIPVDVLQESLGDLSAGLSTMLADLQAVGGFQLSEVRVGVELTAEGGVNLIGNLSVGAKGAIELTFKPLAAES